MLAWRSCVRKTKLMEHDRHHPRRLYTITVAAFSMASELGAK
jgi:hypothetical protein